MNLINRFNIRVYGIVINTSHDVLLCDEERAGFRFTKFPGGGLEFGEGVIDCLVREFREELQRGIGNIRHYYTTEKFQQSAFKETEQVISIYFKVDLLGDPIVTGTVIDGLKFTWKPLAKLSTNDLTFPIDKLVAEKLIAEYDQLLGT
jgi:8-oxo-dGTP diphosphatase